MSRKVEVGEPAPPFELPGVYGGERKTYALEHFRGAPLVLVFYPKDDTLVCTKQLNSYSTNLTEFAELGAQVLAISPQDLDAHEGFAAGQGGFAFPLLADSDKKMFGDYGALGPLDFPRRSVFILDAESIVHYSHRALTGATFRPVSELVASLEKLPEP
ncbi:MAG: peroxiredoxin family protein [Acidimicrobiales bacterium]